MRPAKACEHVRLLRSSTVRRCVVRLRPFPPRPRASSARNCRALGDLVHHDAKECQGLFPPLKYDSLEAINSSRMDVTGSRYTYSAYIYR